MHHCRDENFQVKDECIPRNAIITIMEINVTCIYAESSTEDLHLATVLPAPHAN